jgi:hypothetical protein
MKTLAKLLLTVAFFVLVSPVALVLRIIGSDAMRRKFDRQIESYRVKSRATPREDLEKAY